MEAGSGTAVEAETCRAYELGGAGHVCSGVVPLDAGVLAEMVDVAECILRDCRHGFEWADDGGGCGYRLYRG